MYPMTLASQAAAPRDAVSAERGGAGDQGRLHPGVTFSRRRTSSRSGPRSTRICPTTIDGAAAGLADGADGDRRAEGRFALYTVAASRAADVPAKPSRQAAGKQARACAGGGEPSSDYQQLTLAQLRARLQSLDVDELEALLAYEEATKARAPFQTLLANRITRATAK